jgi:hypothetical protein
VSSLQSVPGAVARYLVVNNLPTGGVCWPSLRKLDWIGAGLGMEDRPARGDDLVGVTGCFCAVAETGTLMLLSGPDTPAAASLLPETHIAIVETARIVPFMEDAWALLRAEHGRLPRAVNFISGPSRTADIEQTVTMGAHGPYRVHASPQRSITRRSVWKGNAISPSTCGAYRRPAPAPRSTSRPSSSSRPSTCAASPAASRWLCCSSHATARPATNCTRKASSARRRRRRWRASTLRALHLPARTS